MFDGMKINAQLKKKYYEQGWWSEKTLAGYWADSVAAVPDKICVADSQGVRLSYTQVDEAAGRLATWLVAAGIQPGDVVTTQLPGWAEFTIIFIAALKAGAVIHLALPNHRIEELRYSLEKCETKVLFVPSWYRNFDHVGMALDLAAELPNLGRVVIVEKLQTAQHHSTLQRPFCTLQEILHTNAPLATIVKTGADDLAALLFTSGTESNSKGVMFTHNVIAAAVTSFAEVLGLTSNDVMFMPAPVAHATGFHHGVITPFMLGATSVLLDRFKPDRALDMIEQEHCTYGMGATPIIHDMFALQCVAPRNLSSIRFFLCGGAPSPWPILEEANEKGLTILSVYGSTESVPHTVCNPNDPEAIRLACDGKGTPRVEVRVVDAHRKTLPPCTEGEECSRGPNVFVGYLKEPELTAKALDDQGWYYSGDLCVMNEQGYMQITGRKKDIIIRGGENISSNEVEAILLRHPKVRTAAVVSMPDERMGERVCAYVELKSQDLKGNATGLNTEQALQEKAGLAPSLTLDEVRAFFESRCVARFKIPERIEITTKIPITPTGKIRKFQLRKDIRKKLLAEGCMAAVAAESLCNP